MADLAKLNQELARLDGALRSGRLDVQGFRTERRKFLLDYDERTSTTTPGAAHASETTLVDPPFTLPPAPAPEAAQPAARSKPMGMLFIGLAALVVVGLGGWWFLGRAPIANQPSGPAPVAAAAETPATPAGSDLPQDVANALVQSNWTEADLKDFLQRWSRLAPEAVSSATDDPRIWLLRGQTEQRLRDALEAESLDASEQAKTRRLQLEQVQAAIR